MASTWTPGREIAWSLNAECPDPCLLFQCLRDDTGRVLDFQGLALNPAAETFVTSLGRTLSAWEGVSGLPEHTVLQGLVEGGEALAFELQALLGPAERWFRARAVRHGDGFILWLFDLTDVHEEQRSLREALEHERTERAREAHLSLALETARMVTWEWVEDRSTFHLSSNADAFFGHPPGGLGESMERLLERVHPDQRQHIAESFAEIRRSKGPHSFTFHGEWPDGSLHCYEVVGQTFQEEGQATRVMGVAMDCTERERAQSALREAEEHYRLAAQATNDVLWDWNPFTGRVRWGEACFKVFGYLPEEMGDFTWWEEQIHPEDRRLVMQGLDQVMATNSEAWTSEYRFRCKNGAYLDVLDRGRVARDNRGRTTRMIGSMMDITERKRAVERMQEEALFRDRFIGILGHDLRNPLNAIILTARELRRRGLSSVHQHMAQRIESSASRMGNMISDILDLTRARLSGGIPLHLTPVSLPTVCRQVVEELTAAYPERLIALETEGACEGVWDTDRLAQVVSNLLGNALEHGDAKSPVFIRCVGESRRQVLEISNPGAPIPPQQLATLFDPFRQGNAVRTGRRSGLGLGLFIVRELVRAHGGQVTVRSTAEYGTTFTVLLPRDSRQPLEPDPEPDPELNLAHSA